MVASRALLRIAWAAGFAAFAGSASSAEETCGTLGGCHDSDEDDQNILFQTVAMKHIKKHGAAPHGKDDGPGRVRAWHGHELMGSDELMGSSRSKFKHRNNSLNGPTLDASEIPKYVTPLFIPGVMKDKGTPEEYDIAVRQFQQQILPGGIWNNEKFSAFNGGEKFDYPPTTVWSFGPAGDPEPDSSGLGGGKGIAPAQNSQFNYPSYTIETTNGKGVKVDWMNQLVKDPWNCRFKCPRGKACEFIEHITPVDQALHWANPGKLKCKNGIRATDCMPKNQRALKRQYRGPVPLSIHVHGAHVEPESDGYPEAWTLPTASNIPRHYAREGRLVNKYGKGRKTNHRPGVASSSYRNDQPSAALWYHDHTLGMTRNSVYAGPAGFWVIRAAGGGEDGLVSGTLPAPAPKRGETFEEVNLPPGRNKYREIPLLIQDRSFNRDGSLFYPKDRAFFQNLPPSKLKIPLLGGRIKDTDIPRIWNPEAFFDVMVVNGVSWPMLDVEPDTYRFRMLNGCNSRTLNLALWQVNAEGEKLAAVPMYIIGGDQSLNSDVVSVTESEALLYNSSASGPFPIPKPAGECLLLAPAYRADVLISFPVLPEGTLFQLFNTAPDQAFGGFPIADDKKADPDTTGQVMHFRIRSADVTSGGATPPAELVLKLPDSGDLALNPDLSNAKDLSLMMFGSAKVCVHMPSNDGVILWDKGATPRDGKCFDSNGAQTMSHPFHTHKTQLGLYGADGPGKNGAEPRHWSDSIAQNPAFGSTETWELWDLTMHLHPIHIHSVKFKVHGRAKFNMMTGAVGDLEAAGPTEAYSWKDTIAALPGYVTYVKATFDLDGLYVWHCHMLEHEDEEMMLPYCVGNITTSPGCKVANENALRKARLSR